MMPTRLFVCAILLSPALGLWADPLLRRVLQRKREIQLRQVTDVQLAAWPRYARQLEHATPPPEDAAETGQTVRLVGGGGPWEGAVEVHTAAGWRPVVSNSWTEREAAVVCRQLGYASYYSETPLVPEEADQLTDESGRTPVSVHKCRGTERSLQACEQGDGTGRPARVACLTSDDLSARCGPGQTPFGDRCYWVGREPQTALKAELLCRQMNATLVTVTSQLKNDFVSGLLESLGLDGSHTAGRSHRLSRTASSWYWLNTSLPFAFTKWHPDSDLVPSDGVAMRCLTLEMTPLEDGSRYAFWRASQCSRRLPYVCEMTPSWTECSSPRPGGYSGSVITAESGRPCLPWSEVTGLTTLDSSSLTGSLCRNPDGDRRAWCFTAPDQFEYCDVPDCPPLLPLTDVSINSTCGGLQFTCAPGECVSALFVCDGDRDCTNGRDEAVCATLSASFQTFLGKSLQRIDGPISEVVEVEKVGRPICQYLCLIDPSCYAVAHTPILNRCVRVVEGLGNMRLQDSTLSNTFVVLSRHRPCPGYQCADFQCLNSSSARCDGVSDCLDGSDEFKCGAEAPIEVRLVSGGGGAAGGSAGRLEARRPGRPWGAVCDDLFSTREAEVVCRQLGFRRSRRFWVNGRGFPAAPGAEYAVSLSSCSGDEAAYGDCVVDSTPGRCTDGEQVSVECTNDNGICTLLPNFFQCLDNSACVPPRQICDGKPHCIDESDESEDVCQSLQVRLRDDPEVESEAPLVQVKPALSSRPFLVVSSRAVGESEANFLCRSLGRGDYGLPSADAALLPQGKFAARVACDEAGQCEVRQTSPEAGEHGLRLRCSASPIPPVELRLVGTSSSSSGLLEIRPPLGSWGRVCSASFTPAQAKVVCRQLGFSGAASFQESVRDPDVLVSLRAMDCRGEEANITDCFRSPWIQQTGTEVCGSAGEVFLTCGAPEPAAPSPSVQLTARCLASARDLERVLGGRRALPDERSWLLRLDQRRPGGWRNRCGATLISARLAITAAHCLLTVLPFNLTSDDEQPVPVGQLSVVSADGERRPLARALRHPGHRALTPSSDDLALLELAEPLELSERVRPACLPPPDAAYTPGLVCSITGYGKTSEKAASTPEEPQTANVTLFSREQCEGFYGRRNVTAGMVCAGDPAFGADTCSGDSGSPLVCELGTAGRRTLLGVTSWGLGCGRPGQPGVYTRVADYLRWIQQASEVTAAGAPPLLL